MSCLAQTGLKQFVWHQRGVISKVIQMTNRHSVPALWLRNKMLLLACPVESDATQHATGNIKRAYIVLNVYFCFFDPFVQHRFSC